MFSGLDVFGAHAPQTETQLPGSSTKSERVLRLVGMLSVAAALGAAASECSSWWAKQHAWYTTVSIDRNDAPQRLTLDVTFPHLHCADADLLDNYACRWVDGKKVIEESTVTRYNIDDGVETPYEDPPEDLCLPCHEAAPNPADDQPPACCNTCRDLVVAFFDRGMLDGRDFTQYHQCRPRGCRVKANVLYARHYGNVSYVPLMRDGTYIARPEVLLAEKWNPSHIIHSATLSPIFHAYKKPIELYLPTMGKLMKHGIDAIDYTALVMPASVQRANTTRYYLTNRNRVDRDARYALKPDRSGFEYTPGFQFEIDTQMFGFRKYQNPPSSYNLLSQIIVTLGSILAFFDFVAALIRRFTSTKVDPQVMRRLSMPMEQLSSVVLKTKNFLKRDSVDAMSLMRLSGTTACSDDLDLSRMSGSSDLTARLSDISDVF